MSRDLETVNLQSSDDRASNTGERGAAAATEEQESGASVDQLYEELRSLEEEPPEMNVRMTPEQRSEVVLEHVVQSLFDGSEFAFDESTVKGNLEEILLVLVAHRSSNTNGKSLMGDLTAIFGTRLSPGTVYPQLHELEDDGVLRVQELVRTKEYEIDDPDALAERVSAAMEQHLTLGLFLRAALDELS
jgi:hypothetical protein